MTSLVPGPRVRSGCPRQPWQPADLIGRRPCPSFTVCCLRRAAFFPAAPHLSSGEGAVRREKMLGETNVRTNIYTPRRWAGWPERDQPKLSQENGFDAEASSQRSTRPPPRRRSDRLTTRPAREPGLTGRSATSEPAEFEWPRRWERMSIWTGQVIVPGTAVRACEPGPPESA